MRLPVRSSPMPLQPRRKKTIKTPNEPGNSHKTKHSLPGEPTNLHLPKIAYIRQIEYSFYLEQNLLRSYKASVFQALGHPTRIAIVELLREGELSAGVIQERLGIEQANVSQHLATLRSRQILTNRKEGNQVFYSLRNPVLVEVLDTMRRYLQANLSEAVQMLTEIKSEERTQ